MKGGKVKQVFNLLGKRQRPEFRKWLQLHIESSRLGAKTKEESFRLYDLLLVHAKDCEEVDDIRKRFYPDDENDKTKSKFQKIANELTEQIKNFIAYKAFLRDENEQLRNKLLLREILNEEKYELFENELTLAKNQLEKSKEKGKKTKVSKREKLKRVKDEHYYQALFELEVLYDEYLFKKSGFKNRFREMNEAFDFWWVLRKLKLEQATYGFFEDEKPTLIRLENFMPTLEKVEGFSKSSVFKVYFEFWRFALGKTQSTEPLSKLLKQSTLPSRTLLNLYTVLLNHFVRLSNQYGTVEYLENVFRLLELGVEEGGVLRYQTYVHWQIFKNLVFSGVRLGKMDVIQGYIDRIEDYIHADDREEARIFNQAVVDFYLGKYEKVVEVLDAGINKPIYVIKSGLFSKLNYKIHARFLLSQTHYELHKDEFSQLVDLVKNLTSLEAFVKNQKDIKTKNKESYRNRIHFFLKLIRYGEFPNLEPNKTLIKLENLEEELNACKMIDNRDWLLAKIRERLG